MLQSPHSFCRVDVRRGDSPRAAGGSIWGTWPAGRIRLSDFIDLMARDEAANQRVQALLQALRHVIANRTGCWEAHRNKGGDARLATRGYRL